MGVRFTIRELRAMAEALQSRLAGEYDIEPHEAGFSPNDANRAGTKVRELLQKAEGRRKRRPS